MTLPALLIYVFASKDEEKMFDLIQKLMLIKYKQVKDKYFNAIKAKINT